MIAAAAGVEVPADTRMLLVPITGDATEEVLAKEKLCPVQVVTAMWSGKMLLR